LTRSDDVQGVIKSYDPATGDGVVLSDADLTEFDLAAGALDGSVFRMLRQGQRVCFELDDAGFAATIRLGSEVDMGTPALSASDEITEPVAEQRDGA
jgi:CspA family cold shock protein